MPPLPVPVRAAAVATDGHRVYVVGGSTISGRTSVLQILDLDARSWSYGPSIPTATDWGVAVWASGALHFLGGVTREAAATTQHLVLAPDAREWRQATPLPSALAGTAALVGDSRIYVMAGNAGRSPTYTAQTLVMNLETNAWSTGLAVPGPRINWAGAMLDGRAYLIGGGLRGLTTSADLLVFDPVENSWAGRRPVPQAREAHAAAVSAGRVCVLGGRLAARGNFNQPFDDVTCYDPASDTWSPAPPLPRPLQELGAVSTDLGIVVVGGADEAGRPVPDVSLLRAP